MRSSRGLFNIFTTGIGRRLALVFLLLVFILCVPFILVLHFMFVVDETGAEVNRKNAAISSLNQMDIALREEQASIYEMAYKLSRDDAATFEIAAAAVISSHEEMVKYESGEDAHESAEVGEIAAFAESLNLQGQIHDITITRIVPEIQSPQPNLVSTKLAENEVQAILKRLTTLNSQIRESFTAKLDAANSQRAESRNLAIRMILAGIIAAVASGLLISVLYTRRLVKPIISMAETATKIARGDLTRRVETLGGNELGDLGAAFNDMTDSLERQTIRLENEKARIRSIHQSIGDGIIVIDRGGFIASVNPAAERMLNKPARELEQTADTGIPALQQALADRISESDMIRCWEAKNCKKTDCPSHGSDDRRCWLQCATFCYNQIQGAFKQKRDACERCDVFISNAVKRLEVTIGKRYYSTSIVPILDDLGQEEGRTVVLHDVTELRQAKSDVEHSAAQLAVLNSVSRAASGSLEFDSIYAASLASIIGGTMADGAFIHIRETQGTDLLLAASQGIDDDFRVALARIPQEGNCPGHVIESGKAVLENDLNLLGEAAQAALDAGFASYVGAPLIVKKEIVGVISLLAVEPEEFTSDDSSLVSMIGVQLGTIFDNANLFARTTQHASQEQARSRIAAVLASSMDINSIYDEFAAQVATLVDYDRISITLADLNSSHLEVFSTAGGAKDTIMQGERFVLAGTAVEWAMKNQRVHLCGNIAAEAKFTEQEIFSAAGLKTQLNLPLIAKGEALGTLNLLSYKENAFSAEEVENLKLVADLVALAASNRRLFEDVSRAKKEWETTFDAASEGIVMVSHDHRIVRLNSTAAEMLGGKVEDLVGRRCYEVIHKTTDIPDSCLMQRALVNSCTTTGEQEEADGTTLEIMVDTIYDDKGKFTGAIHLLRDITEARRLRQQLVQSEKMVAVGQLVAGVAHEINNPLTGVTGYAQLLLSRDLDERTRRDVEQIDHEAERAGNIVRHLLSFSRKHQPERRRIDINQIVREALELKAYDLKVNNIVADTDLAKNLPFTTADPHQLQQVFLNLIVNAEQAMLDAGGSGRLRISTENHDGMITIVFTDSGPGIPDDIRDRIFDPFFTTKDVGHGTGLGLSLCFGIVAEHGGKMWVDKNFRDGARMVVELPVSAETEISVGSEVSQPKQSIGRVGKILVVDDEAAIRNIVRETLKRSGHTVDTARDGRVALAMVRQKHYDCVVTDVKMPGIDGPSFHHAVKESDPELAGNFIFISGDTVSPETRNYLNVAQSPHLSKPFRLDDLESLLQQVLSGKKINRNPAARPGPQEPART